MTTDVPTTLADQLNPLVAELAHLLATKGEIETRERDLKARIREAVAATGPDTYTVGDHALIIQSNNRFDPAKALELIPEEARPLVTRTEVVVDRDKVRALLPEVFEQAQAVGDLRVQVRTS